MQVALWWGQLDSRRSVLTGQVVFRRCQWRGEGDAAEGLGRAILDKAVGMGLVT